VIAGKLTDDTEDKSKDARGQQGLQNHPNDTQSGLFVTQLDIARRQGEKQIAELEGFLQVQRRQAGSGSDGKVRQHRRKRCSCGRNLLGFSHQFSVREKKTRARNT